MQTEAIGWFGEGTTVNVMYIPRPTQQLGEERTAVGQARKHGEQGRAGAEVQAADDESLDGDGEKPMDPGGRKPSSGNTNAGR